VGDVGIAALALLPAVALLRNIERPLDEVEILFPVRAEAAVPVCAPDGL
jgi:hypothetical protein